MNHELIEQIVDWMVKTGTESTNDCTWVICMYEIADMFHIPTKELYRTRCEIEDALRQREEVADVGSEFDLKTRCLYYDIDFYTDFCKCYQTDEE